MAAKALKAYMFLMKQEENFLNVWLAKTILIMGRRCPKNFVKQYPKAAKE